MGKGREPMTPDVVVDIGNSRIKWGWGEPMQMASLPPDDEPAWDRLLADLGLSGRLTWAVAGVHPARLDRFAAWATARGDRVRVITHADIRLQIDVEEPRKVGIDRLLNVLAAQREFAGWRDENDQPYHPDTSVVVIDIGSAMTIDLLYQAGLQGGGIFMGGAILPGPWMMARALHEFTAKLPLVDPGVPAPEGAYGRNTVDSIRAGIQGAMIGAATAFIRGAFGRGLVGPPERRQTVIVTGGGHELLSGLWGVVALESLAHVPSLTLEGIRLAAEGLP